MCHLKSDALLLSNVFKNFRKIFFKSYHLDLEKFLSDPGLVWQAALKKTEAKLEKLTDIDMLLMVEKELGEEYVMEFTDMQKLIINI